MSRYADDLRLALRLADAADAVTRARFGAGDLRVETKPDLTPVTDADRAVEDALRALLAAERPDDAVVGEESGTSGGAGSRRWVIDPIDGTKNFVRRVPVWATLVALQDAGRVVVGVASAPALGRRWWAARGLGAWVGAPGPAEPRPCRVSQVAGLADAYLSYASLAGWPPGTMSELLTRVWRTRAFGDFWQHMLVAEGAVDLAAEPEVTLWDLAALQVIVEEAGGRFTDLAGEARPDGGSALSSNGRLHEAALRLLSPSARQP